MADLYPPSASYPGATRQQYPPIGGPNHQHQPNNNQQPQSTTSSNSDDDNGSQPPTPQTAKDPGQKSESKPQATFLTKLYALLERPENHHMIRWDAAGEHIIVERPEQLALHVLPSIYRQSRFASFSRQLNIYGFMRKVNLRNVDPAIDDPDASTWSHPTLNRHSAPEVVANFKRRVPPRMPKPRKRDLEAGGLSPGVSRPPMGMGNLPLSAPVKGGLSPGRSRGFSAPGSFTPLSTSAAPGWSSGYPRGAIPPPLTVPGGGDGSHHGAAGYGASHQHPITPIEEPSQSQFGNMPYSAHSSAATQFSPYGEQPSNHSGWQYSNGSTGGGHHSSSASSLSSLLNPSSSGGYSRNGPSSTTSSSYASPFSMPMHPDHNGPLSPDSRPTTGYSMSSVSSSMAGGPGGYDDFSRPNSSHHMGSGRPDSPSSRPGSKAGPYNRAPGGLSVRRERSHSQAVAPYPSPYDNRPGSSGHIDDGHGMPRVRSMIQLPSVNNPGNGADQYHSGAGGFPHQQPGASGHADFAYSAGGEQPGHGGMNDSWGRPGTGASSISATSAGTPPAHDQGGYDANIHRFSPDLGFVQLGKQVPPLFGGHEMKTPGEF